MLGASVESPSLVSEVFRLYAGMNSSMDEVIAGYDEAELELIAGFLGRTAEAGQAAADDLAQQ